MSSPAPHLVDEILEEIFLRLPTPAALARASTACPRFRRIVTGRSFLRHYRKRHPPPLLGFVDESGFHPAQEPHPSAPLARALADAADFTYSFVPKHGEGHVWVPCDARDGRVLLEDGQFWEDFRNLAVCDPLSRRYVLLPPISDELAAARENRNVEIVPILAPIGEEDEDETSFKVICFADYTTKLVTFVFSSLTGQWCIAASPSWSSLGTGRPHGFRNFCSLGCRGLSCFDYVRGCFTRRHLGWTSYSCWTFEEWNFLQSTIARATICISGVCLARRMKLLTETICHPDAGLAIPEVFLAL
ncbi:hypothetical protein VPH35_109630 [Triticum aestivum]|uniref:uncharacterized protein n=1 Tax=Triticum aestivum TaxID=4565 RepID=UPI000843D7DD|nr:uncharacterized protein LOC123133756 [Triticum aestivum]